MNSIELSTKEDAISSPGSLESSSSYFIAITNLAKFKWDIIESSLNFKTRPARKFYITLVRYRAIREAPKNAIPPRPRFSSWLLIFPIYASKCCMKMLQLEGNIENVMTHLNETKKTKLKLN